MSRFQIVEAEQRSEPWFAARAGRATGSKANCVIAQGKAGKEAFTRRDYRIQLACERLTGKPEEGGFVSYEMKRGTELEPAALAAYEAHSGNIVRQTGFLSCLDIHAGCSLDGDMDGFKGILELKAPKTNTHIGYWRDRQTFIDDYDGQVLHNLLVSGAEYCDLCSFDDRLPTQLQLLVVRIPRSTRVDWYADQLNRFLAEVSVEMKDIQALMVAEAA